MKVKRIFLLIFLSFSAKIFALDTLVNEIGDDSALRQRFAKTIFIDPPASVLGKKNTIERLESGERVEIRIEREKNNDEFSIILAREYAGKFPGWAQGSFILTRNARTGAADRIRIFLRSDPYTYIQFRPLNAAKSEMDVVVYDAFLSQSTPLAFSMEKIAAMPLNAVLDSLGAKFPRRYFEPDPDNYREVRTLITEIRKDIRALQFGDDGAIDESGKYVYINTLSAQQQEQGLNCSGFAKWVIDGLLRPVTGRRLQITPLKAPYGNRGTNFTEPFERIRDPFFGLDWVRNLAAAALSSFKPPSAATLDDIEVRDVPFQAILRRSGKSSAARLYPGHLPNAGFSLEGIQPLLYTLAIDEPRNLFLGAISTEGGVPRLRTYFHIVVLLPYFDENKVFHVAIFESAEETSFNRFRVRYPANHINLCRVPVESSFTP